MSYMNYSTLEEVDVAIRSTKSSIQHYENFYPERIRPQWARDEMDMLDFRIYRLNELRKKIVAGNQ